MSPSPIRCRGPWKIHKRSSEPDRWLEEMGFFRKHTARDSSCLFRAVSENVFNTQRYFHKVRLDCVQFMAKKKYLFQGSITCPFENYLKEMSNPSEWGGLIEISAISHLYRRDFVIFDANKGPQTKICNGYGKTIYLFYSSETKHFDAVYTKDFINSSSFCQSLVYEILYDGVYQLKDLSYAVDKMLHEKLPSNHVEYFMSENVERRKKQKERAKIFIETPTDDSKDGANTVALKCKHHTDDMERASVLKESLSIFVFNRSLIQLENVCMNCLNVNSAKDLLDNGITPFPYKVAKALDPDIYRNIEFDVWSEIRRELRYGARYSDGTTLQVGVKCLVKIHQEQSVPYHCHIQEMRPDGGPCLVFIEELGEKRVVAYEQLEPLPSDEVRPWAPPYRYSRTNSQLLTLTQMLQQIGNVSKKQNLKVRKAKNGTDDTKSPEKDQKVDISWKDEKVEVDAQYMMENMPMSTYQHLDYFNFEPMPVEVEAVPLMVDCRPAAGAGHDIPPPPANGVDHPPGMLNNMPNIPSNMPNNMPNNMPRMGGSGDVGPGMASPSARASTPATNAIPYGPGMGGPGMPGMPPYMSGCGAGYGCGVKSVVWCPPPPTVNPLVYKSVQANGADLPMNDIPTLRYYYNLGVECMWAACAPRCAPPPRNDLALEMQQMSLHERGTAPTGPPPQEHKHKPQDNKPPVNQQKNNQQRPLLGPRFKRGNNQDGSQNSSHNQNKGHNNSNMGNKGPNNRRNSVPEGRLPPPPPPYGEEGEGVVYVPYPPPVYPLPYYCEPDPTGMMGMMGGMYPGMGYEEGEYPGVYYQPVYPPPLHAPPPHAMPPPPLHAHHVPAPAHHDHK